MKFLFFLKLNNITIAFFWVTGHFNIQGNEQVDRLANTASVTGNSLDIDLPIGDVNSMIKNYSLKIWNEYWNKSSKIKGSHLFSILPKVPNEPWFEKIKLFRRISTQMARLRIGNFPTPANLNKIGVSERIHSATVIIQLMWRYWGAIEMWKKSIVSIWRSAKRLRFPQT